MNLTSLELSIVILTVFAVVSVLGYNAWNSFNDASRKTRGAGGQRDSDFAARDEPVFREPDPAEADTAAATEDRLDHADVDSGPLAVGGHSAEADDGQVGEPVLDPRVECVVSLEFQHPLPGDRLIAAAHLLRRAGSKPVGQDAAPAGPRSSTDAGWEAPRASRSYRAIRVGVLLANRSGPLNGVDFAEFLEGLEAMSHQLDARYAKPDMAEALSRARELDAFCAAQDAQLMIHVDTTVTLKLADLAALAVEADLSERSNNRWVAADSAGGVLFSVSLGDRPNRLSLLLDLPRTSLQEDSWGALVECSRRIVARLGGSLVDDAGQALGPIQLEAIRRQLEQRASTLMAADIPPGSAIAQRLFN